MLKLYASDKRDGRHGLYARLALDACGIITGNRWDGWLSRSRDGSAAREEPSSILQERSYFFHLPDTVADMPYAIVPSFAEWRFPHGQDGAQLPAGWQQLAVDEGIDVQFARSHVSSAVRYRDRTCRMSGRRASTQIAHLCPVKEQEWIRQNSMHQYNRLGEPGPDDMSNLLLLRADLHIEFDKSMFIFVPKRKVGGAENTEERNELVVHMLQAEEELEHEYHNRSLQPWTGAGAGVEWVFTRFAWSIFPYLSGFLGGKVPRRLRVYGEDGSVRDEMVSVERCRVLSIRARGSGSRSQSPQKRSRTSEPPSELEAEFAQTTEEDMRGSGQRKRKWHNDKQPFEPGVGWSEDRASPKKARTVGSPRRSDLDIVLSIDRGGESSVDGEGELGSVHRSFSTALTEECEHSETMTDWVRLSAMKEAYLAAQREGASTEELRAWREEVGWARDMTRKEAVLDANEMERWCTIMEG